VMAIEIDKYPGGLENTGKLVIKLPREKSKRQAILNWSAKIARAQGFDAYTDVGQDYVFVSLD